MPFSLWLCCRELRPALSPVLPGALLGRASWPPPSSPALRAAAGLRGAACASCFPRLASLGSMGFSFRWLPASRTRAPQQVRAGRQVRPGHRLPFPPPLGSAAVFVVSGRPCHVASAVGAPGPSRTLTKWLISGLASCPPLPRQSVRGLVRGRLLRVALSPSLCGPVLWVGRPVCVLLGWALAPGGPESPQPRRPRDPLRLSRAVPAVDACLETAVWHAAHTPLQPAFPGEALQATHSPTHHPGHSASARLEAGARPAPCLLPLQAWPCPSVPVGARRPWRLPQALPWGRERGCWVGPWRTHRFWGCFYYLPTLGAGGSPFPPGPSSSENRVSRTRRNAHERSRPPFTLTAPGLGLLHEDIMVSQAVSKTRKWGPQGVCFMCTQLALGVTTEAPTNRGVHGQGTAMTWGGAGASGRLGRSALPPAALPTGAGRQQEPCSSRGPSGRFGWVELADSPWLLKGSGNPRPALPSPESQGQGSWGLRELPRPWSCLGLWLAHPHVPRRTRLRGFTAEGSLGTPTRTHKLGAVCPLRPRARGCLPLPEL